MSIFDWLHRAESSAARKAAEGEGLRDEVVAMLRLIYDPEIPVNIYDLGLIYGLDIDEAKGKVDIRMTLTAPACPVAESLVNSVTEAVGSIEGVEDATVELVWDPPWTQDRMSEAARLDLGLL
ncbi:MAG TPA: SUF system Fe-S cluster assembly protein [Aromatoleum sp.]|uniref:SUF system Fe-S cluster assembly protein n=1 Tax=Aromatoleum sp. TaxID=2307007 RepID=UPI002B4934B1|nr:SUF system Fe-S cluster assembly protein [Aromatoleum sp.]HJV26892.1 SUF system Fe-S cluster assembly protein [Aromatoleum sp.]